jgi:hypothetical protein
MSTKKRERDWDGYAWLQDAARDSVRFVESINRPKGFAQELSEIYVLKDIIVMHAGVVWSTTVSRVAGNTLTTKERDPISTFET